MKQVIAFGDLGRTLEYLTPFLEGQAYGGMPISFFLIEAQPGHRVKLHKHPYAEVFIVQDGRARFFLGSDPIDVDNGHIVIVPPEVPHGFVNLGAQTLKQIGIHCSGEVVTDWLED